MVKGRWEQLKTAVKRVTEINFYAVVYEYEGLEREEILATTGLLN